VLDISKEKKKRKRECPKAIRIGLLQLNFRFFIPCIFCALQ